MEYVIEINDGFADVYIPDEQISLLLEKLRNATRKLTVDFWPSEDEWSQIYRLSRMGYTLRKYRYIKSIDRTDLELLTQAFDCVHLTDLAKSTKKNIKEFTVDPDVVNSSIQAISSVMSE
jgi:hypothetical protein